MIRELRKFFSKNNEWLSPGEVAEKLGKKTKQISVPLNRMRKRGEVDFKYNGRFFYKKLRD